MNKMKKFVAFILAAIICFSCVTVAFAEDPVYVCPYSKHQLVVYEDGSTEYVDVPCGKSFSTLSAYEAHVLTCPYNFRSSINVTLSNITDTFLSVYKLDTKVWGFVVPVVMKVAEFVQKLVSGKLF